MRTQRDPAAGDARTDHDLVYAARDGDTIAFDALFYRYRDGVFRLGLAITKDPSAAEEIARNSYDVRSVINDLLVDPKAEQLNAMSGAEGGESRDKVPGKYIRHTK